MHFTVFYVSLSSFSILCPKMFLTLLSRVSVLCQSKHEFVALYSTPRNPKNFYESLGRPQK